MLDDESALCAVTFAYERLAAMDPKSEHATRQRKLIEVLRDNYRRLYEETQVLVEQTVTIPTVFSVDPVPPVLPPLAMTLTPPDSHRTISNLAEATDAS